MKLKIVWSTGSINSPVFCSIYLDGLLHMLQKAAIGWWIGSIFCRLTNYELLRWLVETPSRDLPDAFPTINRVMWTSRTITVRHFHLTAKCWTIRYDTVWHFAVMWQCMTLRSLQLPTLLNSISVHSPDWAHIVAIVRKGQAICEPPEGWSAHFLSSTWANTG